MNVMDCEASTRRARAHLRQLARIRWLAIGAVGALVYAAHTALEIRIPLVALVQTLCVYALVNAVTMLRLQAAWPRFWSRHLPVTEHELGAQLLVDIAVLSSVLYFTGGAINPFAACYLLLVLYASVALPQRLAWTVAMVCLLSYAGLHLFRVPLPLADAASTDRALNYSAHFAIDLALGALVAGCGVRLSEMRRSTMAIVVGDLREDSDVAPADWKQSIDVLWGQIQICKRSLDAMAHSAVVDRLGNIQCVRAEQFVLDVAERFRALRPAVQLELRYARLDDALTLSSDHTLPQAVLNFLDNAADASPHSVEMRAGLIDELLLAIEVLDRGPGIPPALRERIGNGLVTTKESGRGNGSGVLIACAAVERFGGTIHFSDRRGGRTRVQIELPLFRPRAATTGEDDDYRRLGIA